MLINCLFDYCMFRLFLIPGRLFALTALAERIGILISVSVLPPIYAASVATFQAAVFFVTAAILGLAVFLIG